MLVGLVTIGDELLIGQVVNSNAAFISQRCTNAGANVVLQTTVGDDPERIVEELERVASQVDVIITTGGLGPTHDDRTVESVAAFARVALVQDQQWLQHLAQSMSTLGRDLTKLNATQAMAPTGAKLFYESKGTAPGFCLEVERASRTIPVYVLPGVPMEMRWLMDQDVVPILAAHIADRGDAVTVYRTLITTGIAESTLAELVGEPEDFLEGGSLAFLPSTQGVRLRIGVTHVREEARLEDLDRIEALLRHRIGRWVVGSGDLPLAEFVGRRLHELGQTVSVGESCTGGMLGSALTDIPGSSAWFEGGVITYSNVAKMRDLGVLPTTVDSAGAVSRPVVEQMAQGVRSRFGTTWGIGITGVAGPDGGSPDKPVGTVWIALAGPDGVISREHRFTSDRRGNRERSVSAALYMLWNKL